MSERRKAKKATRKNIKARGYKGGLKAFKLFAKKHKAPHRNNI